MARSAPRTPSAADARAAWLSTTVPELAAASTEDLLGRLTAAAASGSVHSSMYVRQLRVWRETLGQLRTVAAEVLSRNPTSADWPVFLEFVVPRRMTRIDIVVLAGGTIVPIEMKDGMAKAERAAIWQIENYALDLRDYHEASRGRRVLPTLLLGAAASAPQDLRGETLTVRCCGWSALSDRLVEASAAEPSAPRLTAMWAEAPYHPTPTIIDAARSVFAGHSIEELNRRQAENLGETVAAIEAEVRRAHAESLHTIVFVTGVPGAGKTLAGLSAVQSGLVARESGGAAAFLSGNLPLTRVLQAALARDAVKQGIARNDATRRAGQLVQLVHKFVTHHAVQRKDEAPAEHVIVYDEAQRAWSAEAVSRFHDGLERSEPSLLLEIMLRKAPWSVVVAVVGGGQEIHNGEAGIAEWGRALAESPVPWRIVASPEALDGGDSMAGAGLLEAGRSPPGVVRAPSLHLTVSERSPRARHIARWVNAVLAGEPEAAAREMAGLDGFRLGLTRDLEVARGWLRDASQGELRTGLVASSGALRHRAYGLELDSSFMRAFPLEDWFLAGPEDVRSSWRLEVAMREFDIQGLELDLVGLCWGDDLTWAAEGGWEFRAFRGTAWQRVSNADRRRYLLNKYRVLLTRARDGLVVWVPRGDPADATRDPSRLDRTADYLVRCGLRTL